MRSQSLFVLTTALLTGQMGCGEIPPNLDEGRVAETHDALLRGVQQAKLVPNEPFPDGYFSYAVDIDGNTAAVSMQRTKPAPGSFEYKGAVFLYDRQGSTWSETAIIQSSIENQSEFGESIALEGDLLAIGSPYGFPPPGAVFVFVRSGGTWSPDAQIIAQDGLGSKSFGSSVALSGNTLLIQDPDSGTAGAVYVFVRNAGSWSQEARIAWDEAPVGAIALSNDTALIANTSHTRIFTRTGTTWSLQADLDRDWLTRSMALDGDTLAFAGVNGVRIFSRSGTNWTKVNDIWPAQQVAYGYFGASMAMKGQRIIVGTALQYSGGSAIGNVHTFASSSGEWVEEARIEGESSIWGTSFSATLALSGDTLLIGAPDEDAMVSSGGAAYIYELAPGLENGTACAKSAECSSGFCTDGVCCDQLCAGTCSACSSAKKGQGADGVCGPIASGSDPDAECVTKEPNTCGTTGDCNGSGACEVYAAGTACDDNNPCTEDDTCATGACSGTPRQCALPDACHLTGQCNVSTGECEYPLINPKDPACSPQPASCGCDVVGARQTRLSWMMPVLILLFSRRRRRA